MLTAWRVGLVLVATLATVATALNLADMACCGALPPQRTLIRWAIGSLLFTYACTIYWWRPR